MTEPPRKDSRPKPADVARLEEELGAERQRVKSLETAYASLQSAFAALEGGVLLLGPDGVVFANPPVSEMFGISAHRLAQMSREQLLRELTGLFDDPPSFLRLLRDRALPPAGAREDFEMQRPRWRRLRWIGKPLPLPIGKGQLSIFSDITAEADIASDRQRRAMTDDLTGLDNRRAGEQAVSRETARAIRTGRPLCFAILDVDHFKRVNDTLGHQAGDVVLREMSRCLQFFLRRGDSAARWGGEEFLVILADTALDGARLFAERVRKTIEVAPLGFGVHITVSAGVAELQKGESSERALARADANLYEAKAKGRNRVV